MQQMMDNYSVLKQNDTTRKIHTALKLLFGRSNRSIISAQNGLQFKSRARVQFTNSNIKLSLFDNFSGVGILDKTLEYEHSTTRT